MTSEGTIEHDGIVQRSDSQSVTVKIASTTACSGCHAVDYCTLSQTEEKIIDVRGQYDVAPGDRVTVLMKKTAGYSALLFGYLLPLAIMVIMLIILTSLKMTELTSGALSIGSLIPYYLLLFAFRKQINKKFTFTIKV